MKALTLRQPWAWAVLHAGKWVENRTWRPPAGIIGEPFAIHAGFKEPEAADVASAVERAGIIGRTTVSAPAEFQRGCVVGVATVTGFVEVDGDGRITAQHPAHTRLAAQALASPWFIGPVGMFLADVRALATPIPCRGMLGFWPLPPQIEAEVRRQFG